MNFDADYIPPAALEAGARALADAYYRDCTAGRLTMADTDDVPEDWYVEARAAIAAALNAWPGVEFSKHLSVRDDAEGYCLKRTGIHLPLPTEASDE